MPFVAKKPTSIKVDSLEHLGDSVIDLAQHTEEEFKRLSSSLRDTEAERIWTTPPPKPRAGTLAYADGVHWNPGSGEGFYAYGSDGLWHYLEVPAYVPPPDIDVDPGMVLLETIQFAGAASYASSVSWAGYSHIKIIISNLSSSSASSNAPYIQYHANGSYQATSYVSGASLVALTGTPVWSATINATTALFLYGGTVLDTTSIPEGVSLEAMIFNVSSTTIAKYMKSSAAVHSGATAYLSEATGLWTGGNFAVDGFKLAFSGGANLVAGKMQIYGIK